MPPSNPSRRFDPTPIEQTSKSSRQPAEPNKDNPKPRRFAVEPVETTTESSRDKQAQSTEQEEKPKPRRFAPQAVEHTTKSSKETRQQPVEQDEKPKPRRFAPQVVEESHKSSKDKAEPEKKAHVKFKPEPVSVTYGSTTKSQHDDKSDVANGEPEKQATRKFVPILLDTAKRSRRADDSNPVVSQADKTEYGHQLHAKEHRRHITGSETSSEEGTEESIQPTSPSLEHSSELRRQVSPMDGSPGQRPGCLTNMRTHSFRMPDLDTIESSESDRDSNPSPLSSSPGKAGSPTTASESSHEFYKHATRIRESVDENFTHYLLDLERKKAQQRLEEQALAAFPNADFGYEPPHHYANNDDDSEDMEIEDRPVTWDGHEDDLMDMARRESTTKVSWEQMEMQRHAEQAQQERNANKTTAKQASQSPWWKPPEVGLGTAQPDNELKSMQDRARPPMLGSELVFPRCPSPQPARFDVTQGSTALRNQMCYLTEAAEYERKRTGDDGGLWQVRQAEHERANTVKTVTNSAKTSTHKGLWGGFCVDDGKTGSTPGGLAPPPSGPTGLMTPKAEKPNPFELAFSEGRLVGLQTPPIAPVNMKEADLRHLDAVLVTEREIDAMMERDYPDAFITQVYNYLSLGYPSLARPFDEELSKISRVSMAELRQDDQKAKTTPRGYIRLGPDFEVGGGDGMTEDGCMRWQALKFYVREWAKQEKNMVKTDDLGGNWGTGARRGSWAI